MIAKQGLTTIPTPPHGPDTVCKCVLDVTRQPALILQCVVHGFKLVGDLAGQGCIGVVVDGVLRQQLMVHALHGHGFFQRHIEAVDVVQRLEDSK